jgi:GxxExxY protein
MIFSFHRCLSLSIAGFISLWRPRTMTNRDPITSCIIGCAFKVANELGPGFLEKVYENALAIEIKKSGLKVVQQRGIEVHYAGQLVGDFIADLVVEERVIVELKAIRSLDDLHIAQGINYLKATGLSTCLLINFGTPKIQIRRLMADRTRGNFGSSMECIIEETNFQPAMDDDGQR